MSTIESPDAQQSPAKVTPFSHVFRSPADQVALCGANRTEPPRFPAKCTRHNRCVVCLDLWDAMSREECTRIYSHYGLLG